MKIINIKISNFNKYLILLIFILFSYLFYLSIPSLYNYERLQKELTSKLLKEFKLNTSLSGNIKYRILPSPNFVISDVKLGTIKNSEFKNFAEVKLMKIYISIPRLYNQKKLEINKIDFIEANININKNSLQFIENYFKNKISSKKIEIKKSKLFFIDSLNKEDTIALSTINSSKFFYNKKKNLNHIKMLGSIFNTSYNLNYFSNINDKSNSFKINFKDINFQVQNILNSIKDEKFKSSGKFVAKFMSDEIKINYKLGKNIIELFSDKSVINNQNISFNGIFNLSPFDYNLIINIEKLDLIKVINNLESIEHLFKKNFLLNKNFNGKILININSLKNLKFFNKSKIYLNFSNGLLTIDDTILISDKIGVLKFNDSFLLQKNNQQFFKSKVLFKILDENRFYKNLQILKKNRIDLNDIYLEFEQNLTLNTLNITKLIINDNAKKIKFKKSDITNLIDLYEFKKIKNWIELKKVANQIFADIN